MKKAYRKPLVETEEVLEQTSLACAWTQPYMNDIECPAKEEIQYAGRQCQGQSGDHLLEGGCDTDGLFS